MTKNISRKISAAFAISALAVSLTACSMDSDDTAKEPAKNDTTTSAAAQVFGDGCAAVPENGKGSFDGMVKDPVATAASNNPVLSTLVTAVTEAGLGDTLNSADGITVFAPTNDAFKKIPEADLNAVLADKDTLTAILTHHVVSGQLSPDEVAGTHKTLNGDEITVEGSGEDFTVDGANVICGNVPTANATVYIIDSVLMP